MEKKFKILVEYDGTNYFGWQLQKNGPTIQGEIEKALRKILQKRIPVVGAGRTDRGVHAIGQVAHFVSETSIPPRKLLLALNSLLPKDICIKEVEVVPMSFHAIFSAKSKVYRYRIVNQSYPSALLDRYAYWCPFPLDVARMREGARHLIGTYDFSSFETANSPRKSSVRTVFRLDVVEKLWQGHRLIDVVVEADGFLYNMVRAIVGTLVEVGRGKLSPEDVAWIRDKKERKWAGPTAPAKGLCLEKVLY